MDIRWTPASVLDLEHISDYLRDHHPQYRPDTLRTLYDGISSLKHFPRRGRIGRELGTRELLISTLPYIAVYRVHDQSVEVLRIYHTAQSRD